MANENDPRLNEYIQVNLQRFITIILHNWSVDCVVLHHIIVLIQKGEHLRFVRDTGDIEPDKVYAPLVCERTFKYLCIIIPLAQKFSWRRGLVVFILPLWHSNAQAMRLIGKKMIK